MGAAGGSHDATTGAYPRPREAGMESVPTTSGQFGSEPLEDVNDEVEQGLLCTYQIECDVAQMHHDAERTRLYRHLANRLEGELRLGVDHIIADYIKLGLERDAERGDAQAQANLGLLLLEQGDLAGARRWLEPLAGQGYDDAMYCLAQVMRQEGDRTAMMGWLEAAAARGHIGALDAIESFLYHNEPTNDERAFGQSERDLVDEYNEAVKECARIRLGFLSNRTDDETEEARCWLEAAAERGLTPAQRRLALYLRRQGDLAGACRWYEASGDHEELAQTLILAGDIEGARRAYEAAAERGSDITRYAFGEFLEDIGDDDGAMHWFGAAARQGNSDAQYRLGCHLERRGDLEGAKYHYKTAAKHGNQLAASALARLLERLGSVDGARHWYSRAAVWGDTDDRLDHAAFLERVGNDTSAWDQLDLAVRIEDALRRYAEDKKLPWD